MPFDLQTSLASQTSPAPIVQAGAAVLRRRALDVPSSLYGTHALAHLIDLMVDTMRAAPGVGLAAPQIGIPLRVFVAEDPEERLARVSAESREARGRVPLPLLAIVNPQIEAASEEQMAFYEGCLSVRGYGAIVRRAAAVRVSGFDPRGIPLSLQVEGWPARIMQHEMDHLDGVLYVDRMITRSLAEETELTRLASLPVEEVLREIAVS